LSDSGLGSGYPQVAVTTTSARLLAIPLVAALVACASGAGWSGKALANEGTASA